MTPEEIKHHNDQILNRDFSKEFVEKMKHAILLSHEKYGWMSETYPELAQAIKCIDDRVKAYMETHNKDYLVDIANFAMIEYMHSMFPDAHYTPGDSDKSVGLGGGISHKQLMEEMRDKFI